MSEAIRTLAESSGFVLGHSYESVVVLRKSDGSCVGAGSHYGDPKVGVITPDELWFVTGGEGLQCYSAAQSVTSFFRAGCKPLGTSGSEPCWYVHGLRLESPTEVRVLVDPRSAHASVWLLDLKRLSLEKLRDGPSLIDQPYRDAVEY